MRSYTLPCSVRFFLRPLGLSMRLCSGAPSMALTFKGRTGGSNVNCMFCPPPLPRCRSTSQFNPTLSLRPQPLRPRLWPQADRLHARAGQQDRSLRHVDRRSLTCVGAKRQTNAGLTLPAPCAHTLSPHALATAQFGALWPTAYSALPPNSLPLPVRYPPVVS